MKINPLKTNEHAYFIRSFFLKPMTFWKVCGEKFLFDNQYISSYLGQLAGNGSVKSVVKYTSTV
jgi:hypothetical protein